MHCDDCSPEFSCWSGTSTCRKPQPVQNISLPAADVAALVKLAWEQTRYIEATDNSATGSIYGIEYADKTIARVAVRLPTNRPTGFPS
jgi:hypothetical protein